METSHKNKSKKFCLSVLLDNSIMTNTNVEWPNLTRTEPKQFRTIFFFTTG